MYSFRRLTMEPIRRGGISLSVWKRLQHLDYVLSLAELHTVNSLAERCSAAPSTIHNDILHLEKMGVPLVRQVDHVKCLTYPEPIRYLSKKLDLPEDIREKEDNSYVLRKLSDVETKRRREKRLKEYRTRENKYKN